MSKTSDLTDEDTLRAFRPIRRDDASTTLKIALLISSMSNAVRRYTQRELLGKNLGGSFDPDATETRTFAYDGRGYLNLAPFEAREITTVTLNGTELDALEAGEQVGSSRYLAHPVQRTPENTSLWLSLPEDTSSNRERLVSVTAKWGIVELPDDVELATLHAVAAAMVNPEGVASRQLGDGLSIDEDPSPAGGSLPQASRNLLGGLVRS